YTLFKGVLFVLFAALSINTLAPPPSAHAGGAIMVGFTIITGGKDRVTGKTYRAFPTGLGALVDSRRYLPGPSLMYAYPGDSVKFTGIVWNVDPFPIPGVSVLQIHQKGFNDPLNPLNQLEYFPNRNNVLTRTVFTVGTGLPVVPELSNYVLRPSGVTLSSNAKPGQQLCQFVSTAPMFYLGYIPVVPWFEWKIPDIIKFRFNFGGGQLNGSATDGNGNTYTNIQSDPASGDAVVGNDGQAYDAHDAFDISFGRTMSCVEIAYVYNLVPSVSIDSGKVYPSMKQGARLANQREAPDFTDSQKTQWQLSEFLLSTNSDYDPIPEYTYYREPFLGSLTNALIRRDGLCPWLEKNYKLQPTKYNAKTNSCKRIAGNSPSGLLDPTKTIFDKYGDYKSGGDPLPSDKPVDTSRLYGNTGYRLCYVLSVRSYAPYLNDSLHPFGIWRNSKIQCTNPGKKPKVHIYGDDVRAGKKIVTSLTDLKQGEYGGGTVQKTYGSWGEYASFSGEETAGFATNSGLYQGVRSSTDAFNWNQLTFANRFSSGAVCPPSGVMGVLSDFGCFNPTSININTPDKLREVFSNYQAPSGSSFFTKLTDMPGGAGVYTIDKGKTVFIISNGTVEINRDIAYYSGTLSGVKEIPQLVIVANKINITNDVARVDGWLVANTIDTCSDGPAQLTIKDCNKQLVINGPISTNSLLLRRTFGSNADKPEIPAEIINNNGASYLWASELFKGPAKSITTTHQVELPPRF
ncbi:hypothetical protein KC953_02610, partial [Candidatus Saccharibacteria bacterium]|nr:hypothetical protein [Candidatus Saccharibacteria bacterium]